MSAHRVAFAATFAALVLSAMPALAWDETFFDDEFLVRQAWHRADFERVDMRFPVGSLEVVAHDGDSVVVRLEPHCEIGSRDGCEKAVRRIKVRAREHGKTLELAVVGGRWFDTQRVQIEGRLEVPRELALSLDMGVGELSVFGVGRDARIKLGIGEATVRSDRGAYRAATVNVGIGEASFVGGGWSRDRAGVFGNALRWEAGKGISKLGVDVGIGEASVYLD